MYRSENEKVNELLTRLDEYNTYSRISSLLHWDLETAMPEAGEELRTKEISKIELLAHQTYLNLDNNNLLTNLSTEHQNLSDEDIVIVKKIKREFDKKVALPENLVEQLSKCASSGTVAWQKARKQNDASIFLPKLDEMISLKKEVIKKRGYAKQPYDVLLDEFEPGLTTDTISPILNELKNKTVELLNKLRENNRLFEPRLDHSKVAVTDQKQLNDHISEMIGFDFSKGVTAISAHPFTSQQSPHDVRFTSRYKENDVLYAISSTMHETGHALYEQNLQYQNYGTPLSTYISLGIHESQSRFYENQIGRSKEFANLLASNIKNDLSLTIQAEEIYNYYNSVNPGLIRVDADELTYNLHIIIRFEIEELIFNNNLKTSEIEKVWNQKYEEYLGIKPELVSSGYLQDVHWSQGLFGYFPTYTLGNIYSAQLTDAFEKEDGSLKSLLQEGDYQTILNWFRENIYCHGQKYEAEALIENITGNKLDATPLILRLENIVNENLARN